MNEISTRALQGEVLGPDATVRVIGRARTFSQEVTRLDLPAGHSISELLRLALDGQRTGFPMDYAVSIDGLPVPADCYRLVRPKAGRTVTFEPRLASGSAGRSILMIAAAVAAIVVAVMFPVLVPTILGSAALSSVVGGLLAGGIAVGASMAANALFPIAAPAEAILDARAGDESVYTIQGAQNQADPYGPIPTILGRVRVFPRYAAQPFTSFSGEDQYLRLLFCLGYGPIEIEDLKIGETDIGDLEDVDVETFHGYSDDGAPTLYTNQAFEESLSVELTKAAGWQQRTTPADITAISVDISAPAGIYKIDKETGDVKDYRIRVRVEYSPVGVGTWSLLGELDKTISKQEPKRWGLEAEVPEGQYDVRVSKQSGDNNNDQLQVQEQLFWTTLRTFRADPTIAYTKRPLALVALKIKATGQLNAVIDSFNCVVQGRVASLIDSSAIAWNPSRKHANITLSGGNLIATNSGAGGVYNNVFSTQSFAALSIFRVTEVASFDFGIGIGNASAHLGGDAAHYLGFDNNSGAFYGNGTWWRNDVAQVSGLSTWVDGDTLDIAVDRVANLIWMRVNDGYWNNDPEANPPAGLGGIDISAITGTLFAGVTMSGSPTVSTAHASERVWQDNQETSNPASLFRNVLQGPAIYERVPVEQLDLTSLEAWWEYCDDEGWEYNREHNFRGSVFDQLSAIAAAGRARVVRTDGKWGVIYDEADPPVAQHFTPRNSWGFEEHRVYLQPPHAFRVNFINEAKGWVPDEVIVYDDGYTAANATRFEAIEFPGVTDQDLNWRHARFQLAQIQLRPSTYTLTTNWQAVACTVGDRVYVAHDVTFWGLFQGRVKAFNSTGDIVTLDQEVVFETGKEYQVRIRLADGSSVLRSVVHPGTAGNFTSFALLAGTDPAVGDLVMFGEDDPGPARLLRVREIEWQPDLRARITLVDDAPEIADADTGTIPAFDSGVTTPASLFLRKPSNPQVTETLRSVEGITYTDVQFSWQQLESNLVRGFEAQIRNDSAAVPVWERMALTPATQTWAVALAVTPATYSFRVRAQFSKGTWSDWTALNGVSVAGSFLPPADVANFRISVLNDTATLTWDRVSRDVAYYTIKHTPSTVGATWGAATVLRAQVTDTSVLVPALNGTYLIKAVRSSGVESASASLIIATGANLVALNSVEIVAPDPAWGGTRRGVKVTSGELLLDFVPLDSNTKTLLQFEGADGATEITDETGVHTWTANGDAQIDDAIVAMGAGALLCDGTGDYVDTPDHADFTLGSGAFTIAARFYVGGGNGTRRLMAGQIDSAEAAAASSWSLELTAANVLKFQISNGTAFTSVTGTTAFLLAGGAWHRVVVIRTSNTLRMFVDGVQEGGDVAFAGTAPNSSAKLAVGRGGEKTANTWFGSIDDFSLSTGVARWTAAYTPAPERSEYTDLLTDDQLAALVAVGRYDYITGAGSPTEEIDLGEVFTSRVTATLLAFGDNVNNVMASWLTLSSLESLSGSDSEDWMIILQERHTEDDPAGSPVTWSDWRELTVSDITARAFQFRLWLFSFNRAIVTTVSMADANVDMPDRVDALGDLAVGTGGLTVTFSQPFRHLETVMITAIQSALAGDHPVISSRSETGFTVHVKDATEANVARTVDAVAIGYGRVVS